MICNCCIVSDLLCCFVTHYQKQSTATSVELSASSFIDPALCLMNIRALPLDQYVLQLSYYLHLLIILTSKISLSVSSSSFSLKYCLSFTFFFTTTAYPKRKQLNGGRFYLWLQFQGDLQERMWQKTGNAWWQKQEVTGHIAFIHRNVLEQEVWPSYKTSRSTPSDPVPPAMPDFLKVP